MSYRWHLVRGVPGKLVGHPVQGDGARRFVGKAEKSQEAIDKLMAAQGFVELADRYDDVEAIVIGEHSILSAMAAGELEQLAGPAVAATPALAREALAKLRAAEAPKRAPKAAPTTEKG